MKDKLLTRAYWHRKYVEMLKRDDVDVRFIEGDGLFHIYPLFPIPEAKHAFNEIKKEMRD